MHVCQCKGFSLGRKLLGRSNPSDLNRDRTQVGYSIYVALIVSQDELMSRWRKGSSLDAIAEFSLVVGRGRTLYTDLRAVAAVRMDQNGNAGLRPCCDADDVLLTTSPRLKKHR